MLTVYKIKAKNSDAEYLFKYDLNGNLMLFEVIGEVLTDKQILYFFRNNNFPSREEFIINHWQKQPEFTKYFFIKKVPADLSFSAWWEKYNYKVGKVETQKAFAKLSEADVIKAFLGVDLYNDHLAKTKLGKIYPVRFITKRYFENEYK